LLTKGNAYARIVRTGIKPIAIVPLNADAVTPKLSASFEMTYEYTSSAGKLILPAREVLHLSDLSEDGIAGLSRVKLASQVIALSKAAANASQRVFENGVMAGGALTAPAGLSPSAYENLRKSLTERHTGLANAYKWMVLEEGMTASKWANSNVESQTVESRNHQIEEIARVFGIPRPLLMMDDTSWGSGIEQLGIFFVQYGLQQYFSIWEQELEMKLLEKGEIDKYYFKFNEKALLRGTLKDQSEYFAKALGSGGHGPWHTQDEVRQLLDLAPSGTDGADELRGPIGAKIVN
jgi:HK97 family phage portal protein